jgi:DNA ligase (NAD+)
LERLLVALSIDNVGDETARVLAEKFGSLSAIEKASESKLAEVYGVGEIVAQSVVNWFKNPIHQQILKELLAKITIKNPNLATQNNLLGGKTFVLTGSLSSLTRDEAKELIRNAGGKVSSSVSSKTDYVVVGAEPGSKASEAQRLGVSTISESEFISLVVR